MSSKESCRSCERHTAWIVGASIFGLVVGTVLGFGIDPGPAFSSPCHDAKEAAMQEQADALERGDDEAAKNAEKRADLYGRMNLNGMKCPGGGS